MKLKEKNKLKSDFKFKLKLKLKFVVQLILLFLVAVILSGLLSSCSKPLVIPGTSFGYYIWKDSQNKIYLEWSADRKDNNFSGVVKTDGNFNKVEKTGIESEDIIKQTDKEIDFNAKLSENDYSDELVIAVSNYSYLEFDLKINNKYDLSRINIGKYLNNPSTEVFKIDANYFENLKKVPWYKNHPFSEFFHKLYVNKYLTFIYIFLLGAIITGLFRITKFELKKRKALLIRISYLILFLIDTGIIIMLWYVNGH